MKIILLSNATYSIPAMHFFGREKMLHSVVSFGKINKNDILLEHNAKLLNIPFKRFSKNQLLSGFKDWLNEVQPDLVLVFGFAYKIPVELFAIPPLGFYNLHFSLLPAYRGRNPLFWQLKNGESTGGITIHKMAEDYDSGPVLVQQQVTIFPGENHGLLSSRLSMESVALIARGIDKLKETGCDALYEQNENGVSYGPAPILNDLKINWETQSAKEIENLVNAANPDYGGAVTLFRGQPFSILEVNPAELKTDGVCVPGVIIHADINHGIFVACKDSQFLRINIVQSPEGIFSGFKMALIGIAAGERFESAAELSGIAFNI